MKRFKKILVLALAVILAAMPITQAKANTKAINLQPIVSFNGRRAKVTKITKTGYYNVKCNKSQRSADSHAFISFKAPSTGIYNFTFYNLHKADKSSTTAYILTGCSTSNSSSMNYTDFMNLTAEQKSYTLLNSRLYQDNKKQGILDNNCRSKVTVGYRLTRGEHMIICLGDFDEVDGARDIFVSAFNLKIIKDKGLLL